MVVQRAMQSTFLTVCVCVLSPSPETKCQCLYERNLPAQPQVVRSPAGPRLLTHVSIIGVWNGQMWGHVSEADPPPPTVLFSEQIVRVRGGGLRPQGRM